MMPLVELVRNSITTEEAVFDVHRKQGLTMEQYIRSDRLTDIKSKLKMS